MKLCACNDRENRCSIGEGNGLNWPHQCRILVAGELLEELERALARIETLESSTTTENAK